MSLAAAPLPTLSLAAAPTGSAAAGGVFARRGASTGTAASFDAVVSELSLDAAKTNSVPAAATTPTSLISGSADQAAGRLAQAQGEASGEILAQGGPKRPAAPNALGLDIPASPSALPSTAPALTKAGTATPASFTAPRQTKDGGATSSDRVAPGKIEVPTPAVAEDAVVEATSAAKPDKGTTATKTASASGDEKKDPTDPASTPAPYPAASFELPTPVSLQAQVSAQTVPTDQHATATPGQGVAGVFAAEAPSRAKAPSSPVGADATNTAPDDLKGARTDPTVAVLPITPSQTDQTGAQGAVSSVTAARSFPSAPAATEAASAALGVSLAPAAASLGPAPKATGTTARSDKISPATGSAAAAAPGPLSSAASIARTSPVGGAPAHSAVSESRSRSGGAEESPLAAAQSSDPVGTQIAAASSGQSSFTAQVAGVALPAIAGSASQASPVPAQATVANLSAQIVNQAGGKTSRFDLQLDPLGLGRVDVAVQIDAKGRASASLSFEKSDSASLLQSHVDALSDALSQAGLTVAPGAISFTHARAEDAQQVSASAQPSAQEGSTDSFSGGSGQGGQNSNPSFAQGFNQNSGQNAGGQDRGTSQSGFTGSRAFDAASDAATATDQQLAAYRTLAPRGVDIRI